MFDLKRWRPSIAAQEEPSSNRNTSGLAPGLLTSYSQGGKADNTGVKRILILTAGADDGRDIGARQLQGELARLAPRQARVDLVNPMESAAGGIGKRLRHPFQAGALALRSALDDLLRSLRPDVVVATHPAQAVLIGELDRAGCARDFVLTALVTEPGEAGWARTSCDFFIVPNERAARELEGVAVGRIRVLGFPTLGPAAGADSRGDEHDLRVLWLVNSGRRKASKLLDRLLALPGCSVTLVSDERELTALVRTHPNRDRLEIIDDAARIPALLARHHLVISRLATALVHEAIAAGCPLIAYRGSSLSERRHADLLRDANAGAACDKPREAAEWIDRAWRDGARLLALWRRNAESLGRPHGAESIARFLLAQAVTPPVPRLPALAENHASASDKTPTPSRAARATRHAAPKKLLLCDLHTHTTWSDGKLTIPELVDFYGQRGFDCLCVTDHLCDPKRLLGKIVNLTGLVIPPEKIAAYFAAIEREKKRAWSQYKLLLMAGVEFNKDGYTPRTSAHLLGIDLRRPIDPSLDLPALIGEIHAQGALAIASHPHEIKSAWGRNTLYLWEHIDEFAPLLDAWEIANRDDLFNPVGLKKLPFVANSDFHKPKHIHSWKTLLWCDKDPEAIKQCIRLNRDVSLTLYRDHRFGLEEREGALAEASLASNGR
jgi:processive 1,2-diacylglycerol beta-glucosyltransferase